VPGKADTKGAGSDKGGRREAYGFGLRVLAPADCVPTAAADHKISSTAAIEVDHFKNNNDAGKISIRQREAGDAVIQEIEIPAAPRTGQVTFAAGIPIANEDHHYQLEMTFINKKGTPYGGLGRRRSSIRFEVARLKPKSQGEHLLFTKAIYAEGHDAGEFPYIRDLVYNRIDWVKHCPGDASAFGDSITSVLNRPQQFVSVLSKTAKFQELERELDSRSGPCQYTTPPRKQAPAEGARQCGY
jgi:hypothetical protein